MHSKEFQWGWGRHCVRITAPANFNHSRTKKRRPSSFYSAIKYEILLNETGMIYVPPFTDTCLTALLCYLKRFIVLAAASWWIHYSLLIMFSCCPIATPTELVCSNRKKMILFDHLPHIQEHHLSPHWKVV